MICVGGLKDKIISDLRKLLMQVNLCTILLSLQPVDLLVEAPTSGRKPQTTHIIGRTVLEDFKNLVEENNMLNMNISYNVCYGIFWTKEILCILIV